MSKLNLKTICLLMLIYFFAAVSADCTISVQNEAPLLSKKFGKRTLSLPAYIGDITLKAGETLNAYCSQGISLANGYDSNILANQGILNIAIECSKEGGYERIFYSNLDSRDYSRSDTRRSSITINCIKGAKQLFESNKSLPNCRNYTTFGIGAVLERPEQMVVAGICFDFETLKTKYVKYLAHRSKYEIFGDNSGTTKKNLSVKHLTDLDIPVESLQVLFSDLGKAKFDLAFSEEKLKFPLLSMHEFEVENLVQDEQFAADVKNFEYLLNTVWWRNLRLGSWKAFLNAFQKRIETVEYIVYTGISGNVIEPSKHNCMPDKIFKKNGSYNVPEIIWAYLKPVEVNKHDEFVVFGYNTPFYSADNETIICRDMCNEIDWLYDGDFGSIHLFPAFGVVHCCRPAEIATQLDAFPLDIITLNQDAQLTEIPFIIERLINDEV